MNNKVIIKNILEILIIFLLCLSTQYMIPINILSRTIYIYYVEVILIILFFGAMIDIFIRKKKINIKLIEVIVLVLLFLWFVFLVLYNYFVYANLTGGFIIFRVLVFPIVLVLLLRQYNVNKKNILYVILIFTTFINVYQIYSLICFSNSFRSASALKNINIYLCYMISVIPIFIWYLKNTEESKNKIRYLNEIIVFFNIFIITIFSFLSGSRIAFVVCPFILIFSFFCINKISIKSILKMFGYIVIIIITLFILIKFNVYDAKDNLFRSVNPILQFFVEEPLEDSTIDNIPNDLEDKKTEVNKNNKLNSNITSSGSSNNDNKSDNLKNEILENTKDNTTIIDSNNMRNIIWKNSIISIRDNLLLGIFKTDIEFDMYYFNLDTPVKMIQSPHNFILEIWLALGLPGLIIYCFMIIGMTFKILLSKLKLSYKCNYLLSMFSIFGFSFFQPLVTSYFIISISLWLIIYLYSEEV